ncbi:MAG: hypothetical protein LBR16_07080 [Treponema sp.]|jgi:hypothetical protein|nr:hypothetical protein [Treponema sp.]
MKKLLLSAALCAIVPAFFALAQESDPFGTVPAAEADPTELPALENPFGTADPVSYPEEAAGEAAGEAEPSPFGGERTPWPGLRQRYFEWALLNIGVGFANNILGWNDIFNSGRTITLDTSKLPKMALGAAVNAEVSTRMAVQNIGPYRINVGFSIGVDIDGYAGISKDLSEQLSGTITTTPFKAGAEAGASAFIFTELKGGATIADKQGKEWTFFVAPEVYMPALYLDPPDITVNLDTRGNPSGSARIHADLYSNADVNDLLGGNLDISKLLGKQGANLSLGLNYTLFDFLDVGGSFSHIPLVPAKLKKSTIDFGYTFNDEGVGLFDMLDNFGDLLQEAGSTDVVSNGTGYVYRPMTFDVYGVYYPFPRYREKPGEDGKKSTRVFPAPIELGLNMGFTVLSVYGPSFNMGIRAKAAWKNMFGVDLSTGYRERLWKHSALIVLNFQGIEIDLGVASQSQDFVKSFQTAGLDAVFALKFGG